MTDAPIAFKVSKKNKEPIPFTLEGENHVYMFKPKKQAGMVLPMLEADDDMEAAKAAFSWLDRGLKKADQERVSKRLLDEDDDLDIDDIVAVVEGLTEAASGRPTK